MRASSSKKAVFYAALGVSQQHHQAHIYVFKESRCVSFHPNLVSQSATPTFTKRASIPALHTPPFAQTDMRCRLQIRRGYLQLFGVVQFVIFTPEPRSARQQRDLEDLQRSTRILQSTNIKSWRGRAIITGLFEFWNRDRAITQGCEGGGQKGWWGRFLFS